MIFKNIKRIGLIVSLSILSISTIFSQNTFRINYDVDMQDIVGGLVESPGGNYVLSGLNMSLLPYGSISEIDQTGNIVWAKSYVASLTTVFSDLQNTAAGGYMAPGSSDSDLMLMETNAAGVVSWAKKYNKSNSSGESASRVKELSGGGYIVAGSLSDFNTGSVQLDSTNIFIMKTDATGNLLWNKALTISTAFDNDHYVNDVVEVADGYIFVGSISENATTEDDSDALIFKTDVNGNIQWFRKFGDAAQFESLKSARILSSGKVLIGGSIDGKFFLMRTDINGNVEWSSGYKTTNLLGADNAETFDAFETSDGNYAVVGMFVEFNLPPVIGNFLVKINSGTGNIMFEKFFAGTGLSALLPRGMQTGDGGYNITMTSQEFTGFEYHMVKTDANGNTLDPTCVPGTVSFANSAYTPSYVAVVPGEFSGTSESSFVPVVSNITPTRVVQCITCTAPDPTVSASPTTICAGSNSTISASGSGLGATYNIYSDAGGTVFVSTTATPVAPVSTTTYYVQADLGGCTSNLIPVTVTVTASPTATVSGGGTICTGQAIPDVSIALTGTGPWNVTYTDGTSSFSITTGSSPYTISGGGDGTYTITAVSDATCTGTDSGSATILTNTLPTVVANSAPGTTICTGDQITLTGSGATSYSWTGGATDGVAFTPSAITYTVTGTDVNSCQNTDQVTIVINALPNVVANSTATNVCTGDQITLTGSGATSYTWTGGASDGTAFTPISTTYTVTGTDGNGCQNTDDIAITVNSLPTISIAGTTSICDGDNTDLTASGATSYAWSPSTGLSATTGAIVTATPAADITYTVTGTDVNSCVNSTTVSIVVNALPTVVANVSPSATVCTGSTITLSGSGATSYTWDLGVTDGAFFSPVSTETYTVTGIDGNNCSNTDQITVTVVPPPVAEINGTTSGSVTACSNEMTTLTITPAGGTYLWSTGATTQSIDVMPTSNTNYTATVTIGSCSDGTDFTVTVNTAPTGSVSGSGNNLVCTGTNDTLTVAGGTTYLWNTTETTASIVVTPIANTNYTVVVYDANNCTDTLTYSAAVNPLPTISITGTDTICSGTSTTLSGNGGIGYVWSTTETTQTVTVSPSLNTTYTVTGTDGNGCQNTDQVVVVVMAPPSAAITGDTITCTGQAVTLTAAGGNNYVWNTGETTQIVTVSPGTTTTYTVVAFVGTCTDTANYTVNVTAPPNVSVGADTAIIIGQSFTLNATGASEYSWIPPNDGIDASELNTSNPTASPEESITYCVVGEQYGCVDTACINVEVVIDCGKIFVPNAFSPNGDNNNDCLKVYSNCLETMTLRVYARWGELVFETTDIEGCWDGTFKGQELNTATFAFVLEYTLIDGTSDVLKGNVSLIK